MISDVYNKKIILQDQEIKFLEIAIELRKLTNKIEEQLAKIDKQKKEYDNIIEYKKIVFDTFDNLINSIKVLNEVLKNFSVNSFCILNISFNLSILFKLRIRFSIFICPINYSIYNLICLYFMIPLCKST